MPPNLLITCIVISITFIQDDNSSEIETVCCRNRHVYCVKTNLNRYKVLVSMGHFDYFLSSFIQHIFV